ncbi:MAG: dynamin family protein [Candidatus Sumerlaeia bacterium]|nr:dynamin family protein [Candidatus Sumerlaeia bacterium]
MQNPAPYTSCIVNGSFSEPTATIPAAAIGYSPRHGDIASLVEKGKAVLGRLGGEFAADCRKFKALSERFAEDRFHLAVLGQFKRGKSTLLNALLGEAVLPSSVVPLTAIPTFIRHAPRRKIRVVHRDNRSGEELASEEPAELAAFLARFVAESANPHNVKEVARVEVFHPAPLLQDGVVLIDTPGIGSTFRHNTATALNFLAECDAALFVTSADPPLTENEVEFLKKVQANAVRVFFIFNKADYLAESELHTAVEFFRQLLVRNLSLPPQTPIFVTSALRALKARESGDTGLLHQSGVPELERHLQDFLANGKTRAFQTAVCRKACEILGNALMRLQLTLRALQMPLADLQNRLHVFEQKLHEVERQRVAAGDLIEGDRKRLRGLLESEAEHLRTESLARLRGVVQECFSRHAEDCDPAEVERALEQAVPEYFESKQAEVFRSFSRHILHAFEPYQARMNDLIHTLRKAASGIFDIPLPARQQAPALEISRPPHWVSHEWFTTLGAIPPDVWERLLPRKWRQSRRRKRLMAQVELLVVRNVENLRWSLLQDMDDLFRRFRAELDAGFEDARSAILGAIEAAKTRRAEHQDAATRQMDELHSAENELQNIAVGLQEHLSPGM